MSPSIADIEATLPWGLHDAYLEALEIDWPNAKLVMSVRVMITERQDMDRRMKLIVTGLVFCVIDPPRADARGGSTAEGALWIDSGEGAANEEARATLPEVPAGCFLHWFFVHPWNSFVHVCGERAALEWTEVAPVPARAATRARFPGDEVADS